MLPGIHLTNIPILCTLFVVVFAMREGYIRPAGGLSHAGLMPTNTCMQVYGN